MTEIASREMYKVAKLVPKEARGPRQEVDNWWKDVERVTESLTIASQQPNYETRVSDILRDQSGFGTVTEIYQFIDTYESGTLAYKAANRSKYEKALESTSLVSQSVFLMVEDQVGWSSAISVDDIEEWLPVPLKGLGEAIVNNLVSNTDLRTSLDGLDTITRSTRFTSRGQVQAYVRTLDSELRRVSSMEPEDDADQNFYEERTRVMVYLQHKANISADILERLDDDDRVEIPENKDKQLDIARGAMDYIEDSGFKFGDLLVSRQSTLLIVYLSSENVSSEVKREISARLHLLGIYQGMYGAGGFMDPKIHGSIPNVMQNAYDNQAELSMADMTFFLRDGSNGMEVGHFWDELMDINYGDGYIRKIDEILGDTVFVKGMKEDVEFWKKFGINPEEYFSKNGFGSLSTESLNPGSVYFRGEKCNFQYDPDVVRKQIVRRYLISKTGGDPILLSRGLELADRLIVATGEDATMNAAFAGHHDLAELILTEANTYDRKSKGKTIGSRRAMRSLVSLTPTWLRAISDRDAMGPLKCKDIDFDAMGQPKGSEYFYYTAILMKKTIPYQRAIMEEGIDLKTFLQNPTWKDLYDQINKVAKYPSIIVDAKRGPSPGKDPVTGFDIPGPVLRDKSGAEILDIVFLPDGSVDMARSNILSMPTRPSRPPRGASASTQEAYKESMRLYGKKKKEMAYRKEYRLRETIVEGIAHLSASRPELGMSITQFRQMGTLLVREMVLRDDEGHRMTTSFLTRSQWDNIYEAYRKGVSESVASRKITKREMKVEEQDIVADTAEQVIKSATSGK